MDKRGREVNQTSSEDLRKYYQLEDEAADGKEDGKKKERDEKQRKIVDRVARKDPDSISDQSDSDSDQDESDRDHSENAADQSESETASSSDSGEEGESFFQRGESSTHVGAIEEWSEEASNVPLSDAMSHRLAVCNMDWDHVGAKDIFGEREH